MDKSTASPLQVDASKAPMEEGGNIVHHGELEGPGVVGRMTLPPTSRKPSDPPLF